MTKPKPTSPLTEPLLVWRNGRVAGLQYSFEREVRIRFAPSTDDRLLQRSRQTLFAVEPDLMDRLKGPGFERLVEAKATDLKAFWARRGAPAVDERMVTPLAIEADSAEVRILYDAASKRRYSYALAIRQCIEGLGDEHRKANVFGASSEVVDGDRMLPGIEPTIVGASIVRVVNAIELDVPVALLTMSGDLAIEGSDVNTTAASRLSTIGGAVCPDKESHSTFDITEAAKREAVEESGVGFEDGVVSNAALMVHHDGQLAIILVHDLTHTPVTVDWLAGRRAAAPDAAEAQRYVEVPLTQQSLSYIALHPQVESMSWTTLMLVSLAGKYFGRAFATELTRAMCDPGDAFDRIEMTPEVKYLERSLRSG